MQNQVFKQITKILFVLVGISIIIAGIFLSKSSSIAGVKEGQKFEDWTVSCSKDAKEKRVCSLVQSLSTVDKDNKTTTVAAYQMGFYGETKELKIIEILPLGINVSAGTSLISSGQLLIPGKFTTCSTVSCNAVGAISQVNLDALLASQENTIAFINIKGEQINLPFSANGLKEGLKAIK